MANKVVFSHLACLILDNTQAIQRHHDDDRLGANRGPVLALGEFLLASALIT